MKIAHLSAEVSPFAKTGGLGDVVGALPIAQAQLGHDVTVWMPYYRQVRAELGKRGITPEVATEPFNVELGFNTWPVGIMRTVLPGSQVPLYLVGCEPLFDRPQISAPNAFGADDGIVRYSVFVRAVMESMRRLRLVPQLLNAHDWHAALAPMSICWDRPRDWHFGETATVLTLHNLAYQGVYHPNDFVHLGLPQEWEPATLWKGDINLMKAGLLAADGITAVSPTFAWEITTHDGSFDLDRIVSYRANDLVGIVNGIDTQVWNPEVDPKIPHHFSRSDMRGKAENRRTLLTMAGLDIDDPGLVVGVVGRLTHQKGYDLLFPVLDDLLADGIRFVFLGTGESNLENQLRAYSSRERGRFWSYIGFDETRAPLIEAGSDTFLMPSRFEPCGLNQLYSLAYGTPPIVRRVGGLADTVTGYDGKNADVATGFSFDLVDPLALRDTVRWAKQCFADKALWSRLMANGMAQDFSWRRSAESYLAFYERTIAAKAQRRRHP